MLWWTLVSLWHIFIYLGHKTISRINNIMSNMIILCLLSLQAVIILSLHSWGTMDLFITTTAPFVYLYKQYTIVVIPLYSCQHLLLSFFLFMFSHSTRWNDVSSWFAFDFHFSNEITASFSVWISIYVMIETASFVDFICRINKILLSKTHSKI